MRKAAWTILKVILASTSGFVVGVIAAALLWMMKVP